MSRFVLTMRVAFAFTTALTFTLAPSQLAQAQLASLPTVAQTPPMGWNSWNYFFGKVTDKDTFSVMPEMLSILNIDMHRVVEPGVFDLMVGPSSDKVSTVKLTVTGINGDTGKSAATAPVPSGSETNMVSNFDEGKTTAAYGMWIPASDNMNGGKSTSKIEVIQPGAANTRGAMQVTGEVVSGGQFIFAGAS